MIFKLRELTGVEEMGGTMRLGAWPCVLAEDSIAARSYEATQISERHRHRYEFNREYEALLTGAGLRITGTTPDATYVEIVEIPGHPFFLGCQFHPEFKSKPLEPHPLFRSFIAASYQNRLRSQSEVRESGQTSHPVPAMNDFEIGTVRVGSPSLFLIAGPCVIESETHARFMADAIQRITSDLNVPYIFKASYDKANRTSATGFRGPGLEQGVGILRRIAEATGLPVITDVHQAGRLRARGRSGRRAADSGVSLPADRPAAGGGQNRARRQHQEGPVRCPMGYELRGR